MIQVRYGGGSSIGCLIFGVLFLVAAYYILKGLFALLWWAAPALFVLALIINWRAVADTGKEFLALLGRNPLGGLLLGALAVVGFPILSLYLFVRALGYSRVQQLKQTMRDARQTPEDEFVEFEELESRPKKEPVPDSGPDDIPEEPIEPLEMPEKEKPKPENPYDQLFH